MGWPHLSQKWIGTSSRSPIKFSCEKETGAQGKGLGETLASLGTSSVPRGKQRQSFCLHPLHSVLPYSPSTFAGGISADPQTRRQLSPRNQTSPLSWSQSYLWHRTLQMLCQKQTKVTTEQQYIHVHFYLLTTLLWPLIAVLAASAVTTEKTQNRSSSSWPHRYTADELPALSGGAK